MFGRIKHIACLTALVAVASGLAGEIYQVTSTDGKKQVTYELFVGRGKSSARLPAFDPQTKKFVYLEWADEKPKPAALIWDHLTGRTIELFKIPNADHPLPLISGIEDMKACPFTGDKKLKIKKVGNFD
jgi:hypothetical protein